MKDLLTATSRNAGKGESSNSNDEFILMRVWQLRSRLLKKGLCADGSRETMIARLKGSEGNAGNEEEEEEE